MVSFLPIFAFFDSIINIPPPIYVIPLYTGFYQIPPESKAHGGSGFPPPDPSLRLRKGEN